MLEEESTKGLEAVFIFQEDGFGLGEFFNISSGSNFFMNGRVKVRIWFALRESKLSGPLVGTISFKTAAEHLSGGDRTAN